MSELLCEVLSICYAISQKSDVDMFFNYSPHCDSYSVYYWIDGSIEAENLVWIDEVADITEVNIKMTILKLRSFAAEKGVQL